MKVLKVKQIGKTPRMEHQSRHGKGMVDGRVGNGKEGVWDHRFLKQAVSNGTRRLEE